MRRAPLGFSFGHGIIMLVRLVVTRSSVRTMPELPLYLIYNKGYVGILLFFRAEIFQSKERVAMQQLTKRV